MENQAKKRKGGAENLRDKKTSPALDEMLPIENGYVYFTQSSNIKCSNKGPKIICTLALYYGTPELASNQNRMCMQVSCGDVTGADSGGPVWIKV